MPILAVRHLTRYRYRKPVALGEHRLMLRPREGHDQRILRESLVIAPEPTTLRFVHDVFGNSVALARFSGVSDELSIESRIELDHRPEPPAEADAARVSFPVPYDAWDLIDLASSLAPAHSDIDGRLAYWVGPFVSAHGRVGALAILAAMTRAIQRGFTYSRRLSGSAQSPAQTLATGSGTCRDFAVLLMEAARALRMPARFVSGYIRSGGQHQGGGHTHAWVRVYLPHCGWVEFDPTNGIVGSDDLIRVAVAREPGQACPLSGSFDGDADDCLGMDVEVDVRAIGERPRIRRVA